jgi:outer membrane protein assembly factor BamD (BamD/ComL family)
LPYNIHRLFNDVLRGGAVVGGVRRSLKVFLCHASGDKPPVREFYKRLVSEGVDAWLDQEKLLPGQDWRVEIPRAVQEADVVIVFLSKKSVSKEGYVQKEIKFALDIAEEKPEGTIFLIPARLEDCLVPERLSRWQWVDLYEENGFVRLLRSLKLRAAKVGAVIEPTSYVDTDREFERRLEQLYTEGLAAFWVEDWDKACQRFRAILSEYPNHASATEKLAEAERQRNLAMLYARSAEACKAEDWQTAIKWLEELLQKSADYKDGVQLIKNAKKQRRLKDLYGEAKALHTAQKWQAVIKVFEQISALDPSYPDSEQLLASAQKEVAELNRLAELNDLYSQAVRDMDAGQWVEARKRLEQVHKSQIGFLETERLLRKVEDEIAKAEEQQKRTDQINTLYEQAHGLARSKKWRKVAEKIEEIRDLDDQFVDKDGILDKARTELDREEKETQRQNELAAMYAEAVRLLKEEKYQEALDKWQEVRKIDPKYPDRQWVQGTVKRKLAQKSRFEKKKKIHIPPLPRKFILSASISGLILLGFIAAFIYTNQTPTLPQCTSVPSIKDPLSVESKLSSSFVIVDGKITYPAEWMDAQCYHLYFIKGVASGCTGDRSVPSTWFVKNDKQRLYFLIRIPKAYFTPEGVELSYLYPYPFTGSWQHSDTMGFRDGKPLDQYGWDEKNWYDDMSDGGRMDTRAKTAQADQYYWYELSKPLDSGDGHDWSWKPGDKIGTDITGVLVIGSWGDLPSGGGGAFVCRNIQLQLDK